MNRYRITIPCAGSTTVEVEATDEDEARTLAFEKACDEPVPDEFEYMDRIVQGNVCYAPVWEIEVEDLGEVDSDGDAG